MDLQNPEKKMSKSDETDKGYVSLFDDPNIILKKIKSAVTDSIGIVQYDVDNQPGIANLLTIYSSMTDESIENIISKYKGLGYKEFKEDLAEIVSKKVGEIQQRYNEIISSNTLDNILDQGRQIAQQIAYKKLEKCKQKLGLGRKRK
jgi:tryptophanyl-tRNA synthetase